MIHWEWIPILRRLSETWFYLPCEFPFHSLGLCPILLFSGIIRWRGVVRFNRLLIKPYLTSSDRFSLYGSSILFQWLLAIIVAWRSFARTVSPEELGLAARGPWQVVWASIALSALLCFSQFVGIRKIAQLPEGQRGSVFAITERIMPRTRAETFVYAALACTAGISEEFLYRGFVFMAFVRMVVNFAPPNAIAATLSSAWFSLAHLYQGRKGIATTFVVGMIFAAVRIWTGSLVPAIAAHIGIDLVVGLYASRLLRKA
jgi:membrane protease YdiL (CAAX protease family)